MTVSAFLVPHWVLSISIQVSSSRGGDVPSHNAMRGFCHDGIERTKNGMKGCGHEVDVSLIRSRAASSGLYLGREIGPYYRSQEGCLTQSRHSSKAAA